MKWWPIYGLRRRLTERRVYVSPFRVRPTLSLFSRSLFIYVIDVGSSNALNFTISALESPLYNIHRYGIFITDSPRHADLLLVLGKPTKAMLGCLQETITQMPKPFGIVSIDDSTEEFALCSYPELPNLWASLKGVPDPSMILGLLIDLSKNKKTAL